MTFIEQDKALDPSGSLSPMRVDGDAFSSAIPLAPNASVTTGWIDGKGYKRLFANIFSDQLSSIGGILLEYSMDGNTVIDSLSASYTVPNDIRKTCFPLSFRFFRYTYTNGSIAQTKFAFRLSLQTSLTGSSDQSLSGTLNGTTLAQTVKSVMEAPDAGGTYDKLTRTDGALNVNISNAGLPVSGTFWQATQPVSASSLPLPAGAATSALQTTGNTSLSAIGAALAGTLTVIQAKPSSTTLTNVTAGTSSLSLLAANAGRKGATVQAEGLVYVLLGSGSASLTNYTVRIPANGYYEIPFGYTGAIAVYAPASAICRVTEFS